MSKTRIIKIAITGPESTGKSQLAELLANHYKTLWVPEFARVYLTKINRPYNYDDIREIAHGQQKSIEAILPLANKVCFLDTELLVTKIWCDVKYNKCHPWIIENLEKQYFDLYLLTDVDLPWEFDPFREHPNKRKFLFDLYKTELDVLGFNYRIVSGVGAKRLKNALGFVSEII
jgi:NadR type nicotinamide-nucleotide adenylyltransferase